VSKWSWLDLARLWSFEAGIVLLTGIAYDRHWGDGIFRSLLVLSVGGVIAFGIVTIEVGPPSS
jgi:hypothetical protein